MSVKPVKHVNQPQQSPLIILHTEASEGWGGQEIRILTEAQGMAALGHRVTLACTPNATILREAQRFGVSALALPIGKKRPSGVAALRSLLAHQRFDVVNTHSSTDTWLTALAVRTLSAANAPALVRTRHISAPIPNNASSRWLYRHASQHIVTTGEALRLQVMRETGVSGERVESIPTGIDLQRYRPLQGVERQAVRAKLGIAEGDFVVGVVATLRSWKGHRYVIDALHALESTLRNRTQTAQTPPLKLLIVGDGPQEAALKAQIDQLGIGHWATLAGKQNDVAPYLQSMDCFCLPSYANEGVPQALMQAMACALPVVTTSVGAIGEIVEHNHTGLMVAPQDSASIGAAISQLIAEPATRDRLGRAALARAVERFALEIMIRKMEAVFRQAAQQRQ